MVNSFLRISFQACCVTVFLIFLININYLKLVFLKSTTKVKSLTQVVGQNNPEHFRITDNVYETIPRNSVEDEQQLFGARQTQIASGKLPPLETSENDEDGGEIETPPKTSVEDEQEVFAVRQTQVASDKLPPVETSETSENDEDGGEIETMQFVHEKRRRPRVIKKIHKPMNNKKHTLYIYKNESSDHKFHPSDWLGKKEKIPLTLTSEFIINPTKLCPANQPLDYIILVNSATGNSKKRDTIRNTYGKKNLLKNMNQRVAFLLGKDRLKNGNKHIRHEASRYGDVIQGDFKDSYHNLTLKGVMGLRWVSEFCPGVKVVMKVDDDVFVNIFNVGMNIYPNFTRESRTIGCKIGYNNTREIFRDKNHK